MATKKKKKSSYQTVSHLLKILLIILIIVFALWICVFTYHYAYKVFADEPIASSESDGEDVTVRVDSDMSIVQIGKMLEENGLIEDWKVFVGQAKMTSYSSKIQAGTYSLNTSMTAEEMIKTMAASSDDEEEDE